MRDQIRGMSTTIYDHETCMWSALVLINDITKFPMTLTFVIHQEKRGFKSKDVWYNMQESADAYDPAEQLEVNLDQLTFDD